MKQHKAPVKARTKVGFKPANNQQKQSAAPRAKAAPQAGHAPLRFGSGDILYGRHAVAAALANPDRTPRCLWLTDAALAGELGAPKNLKIEIVAREALNRALPDAVHQGIVLSASPLPDLILDEVLTDDPNAAGPLVLLDQVTDPHNIGAILRSAAVFGARALITTERNTPADTAVLAKSASGALELVPIVRVVNLSRALNAIGEAGYWRLGLAEGGTRAIGEAASGGTGKIALVLGAEGPGLRRLTKENCDELVNLPAQGSFTTLNVSNAAAVALYAITSNKA